MGLTILDFGRSFGLPTAQVFAPIKDKLIWVPEDEGELREALSEADLVCFGGGSDIHPSLYGCADVGSMVGQTASRRDIFEQRIFQHCLSEDIPMFGICRGAQFLCAMSGGKLVQDVTGHGGNHTLTLSDGQHMPMTSTHHQMMYPWNVKHELLAWTKNLSTEYFHDIPNYVQPDKDPEVVYFPDTRSLAVQGHPEWMDPNSKTVKQVRAWITSFLNINL